MKEGDDQMNPGGDAAEQVVRLSLEGVEVAARITSQGTEQLALLLYTALKQEQKTKGKARLTSMLKSGKELKVYTITQKDLAKFSKEAKRYGVLYCVLKDRKNTDPNAAVDVIARAEDASKIQRITERFRLATVDRANVSLDIQRDRDRAVSDQEVPANQENETERNEDRSGSDDRDAEAGPNEPKRGLPPEYDEESREGRRIMGDPNREEPEINPDLARTDRDHLSEPRSMQTSLSNGSPGKADRPSVKEKLEEYKAEIAREKAERLGEHARDMVSRGIDAAGRAVRAVTKAPGKER